jgi:hypothetical protein
MWDQASMGWSTAGAYPEEEYHRYWLLGMGWGGV